MILGTSSGSGKSITSAAICRILKRRNKSPVPFKGQNMSNNAWVDRYGGEMAHSQAVQAWASGIEPESSMNPILLKPMGDSKSEIIHLGKSVGISNAKNYYRDWFSPGWEAIKKGLKNLEKFDQKTLILEGAGSPVEINLMHRDLTNLRLAKYLSAKCILVADIERGGVFAQIIGTLELLNDEERKLIKGIIINRFRGDDSLFKSGIQWIETKTNIPVLGIIPWLENYFPPEDSLDLLENKQANSNAELLLGIIKLPYLSNFSDFDPLFSEESLKIEWINRNMSLKDFDGIIIPGSKQTIKDKNYLDKTGLSEEIIKFSRQGGHILGICGGFQILGEKLYDPINLESNSLENYSKEIKGLGLLPLETVYNCEKTKTKRDILSNWPIKTRINGFEVHHGMSTLINNDGSIKPLFEDKKLGYIKNANNFINIVGTYMHGIFDDGRWRRSWINTLRRKKNLPLLSLNKQNYFEIKEKTIDTLADAYEENLILKDLII
tara:strand:+ start:7787 stop:9268 length:1482 start_codon:yes stop_codon:yes gene_type:complete